MQGNSSYLDVLLVINLVTGAFFSPLLFLSPSTMAVISNFWYGCESIGGCVPARVGGAFSAIIIVQKENKHIHFWFCSKIP